MKGLSQEGHERPNLKNKRPFMGRAREEGSHLGVGGEEEKDVLQEEGNVCALSWEMVWHRSRS